MGRAYAWYCDRCGKMTPDEAKPPGWYELSYIVIGRRGSESKLFCQSRCASIYFRTLEDPEVESDDEEAESTPRTTALCPRCGWESHAKAKSPRHSLRMHFRRAHAGEGLEHLLDDVPTR